MLNKCANELSLPLSTIFSKSFEQLTVPGHVSMPQTPVEIIQSAKYVDR